MCQTHLRCSRCWRDANRRPEEAGSLQNQRHSRPPPAESPDDDRVCTAGEKGAGSLESRRLWGRGTVTRDSLCSALLSAPSSLWPSSAWLAPGEADLSPQEGPAGTDVSDLVLSRCYRGSPPRGGTSLLWGAACVSWRSSHQALAAMAVVHTGRQRHTRVSLPQPGGARALHAMAALAQKAHFSVSSHLAGSNEVVITSESGCSLRSLPRNNTLPLSMRLTELCK